MLEKKTSYLNIRKIIKDINISHKFKIINIVGTNGKSSLANYLTEGLIKNGFIVGTFISPHLFSPTERIKVNNVEINEKTFFNIKKFFPELNFFETLYLVALFYFDYKKVDIAIIEAGIGGNNDTTKSLQGQIGLVTSIGLDHEKLLGNTLEEIAKDKSGIINSKMRFYIPNILTNNLQKIFMLRTKHFFLVNNKANNFLNQNQILASTILKKEFNVSFSNFSSIQGRVNIKKINDKEHIFDVGHNYHGIKAVVKYLEDQKIKFYNVVVCMKKKKDVSKIMNLFKNKNLYYFKLNEFFHDFKNVKKIDLLDFKKFKTNTLFIGSFHFIFYLYEKNFF